MTEPQRESDARLDRFLSFVSEPLRNKIQRATFARYAVGLLSDAERKSLEPLAARSRPDAPDAEHKAFCYFVGRAVWDDRAVRRRAVTWALWGATAHSPVRATIVDDTGMLKQGTHSVGVARQYTGSAGKVTNCQIAVTLALSTDHDVVGLDAALYLPESWANDPARREEARIPADVEFRTKSQIALAMLQAAHADGVPLGEVLLGDADYGRCSALREWSDSIALPYALGVHSDQLVWDVAGVWTRPMTAAEYAAQLTARNFRRISWREGSDGKRLSARFAFLRVYVTKEGREPKRGRDRSQWLVIEWRDGEALPEHFHLSTLPRTMKRKKLVRQLKERWRIERLHEDLKGEVGFDHFEGRSWCGWTHHVTVALCAHALLVGERCVAFPPSGPRRARRDGTSARTPRAPHPRLRPLRAPAPRPPRLRAMVASLPLLPTALRAGGARLDGPLVGLGQ
jgi:SRSO17 transposase